MEGLSVAVKVQRSTAEKEINGDIRNLKRLVELCDRLGVFLGFDLLNLMREYAVVVRGCWRERESTFADVQQPTHRGSPAQTGSKAVPSAERKSHSRETALSKTDVTIPRLLHAPERLFSSLVFATVAHSAPSLGSFCGDVCVSNARHYCHAAAQHL